MPTRDEQKKRTRKKLEDAFKRLQQGKPINIQGKYKISPSKVEDEAEVSRSTIYGSPYKDILAKVQSYKLEKVASETGLESEVELLKTKIKELRTKLAKEEIKRKEVTAELKGREVEFLERTGEYVNSLSILLEELPEVKRKKINSLLEKPVTSSKVVPLKSRNR